MPQVKESLLYNLAHELRQPLSTMESIAYYLELALPQTDPRVLEQLTRLRHLVEQSGWILNDALSLAQAPSAQPQVVDLDEIVSEFVYEQMQHDGHRPHFELELAGAPAWMDYQQASEMVSGLCRLFRTLAKPGSQVLVSTRVLSSGSVLLRVRGEGVSGEDGTMPAGANLTIEGIEKLAAQNSASVFMSLSDPTRLEMSVEVPIAPRVREEHARLDEVLPAFEAAAQAEPVAPGIL